MRIDNLQQFVKLRSELSQEKEQLAKRLAHINEALGEIYMAPPATVEKPSTQSFPEASFSVRRGRKPSSGGRSLREHVLEALRDEAMTKEEVLDAVQRRGYEFSTNNPLNSLGVILYGKNPKFNRADGKFSLRFGAGSSAGKSSEGESSAGGRRPMSPAARARIAEAQRQRWAATRKAEGKSGIQSSPSKNGSSGSGKRQISAAGRKAIAEAARKRWAAAKRAGKNSL